MEIGYYNVNPYRFAGKRSKWSDRIILETWGPHHPVGAIH